MPEMSQSLWTTTTQTAFSPQHNVKHATKKLRAVRWSASRAMIILHTLRALTMALMQCVHFVRLIFVIRLLTTTWNVSPELQWRTMELFSARVAQQVAVTMLMLVGSNACVASMVWIGLRCREIACCVQTSWETTGSQSHVATKKSTSVALRSLSTHVVHCPFCVQPLREFVESPAFQAAAVFHGYCVNPANQPSNRGVNSMVVPTGFPQPPETVTLLCCAHVGPPPVFEQTSDRRMEWSPVWQPSSSSWIHQWLCASCSRTVHTSEIGDIHQLPCAQCGVLSHMVLDCSSRREVAMVPTMSVSHRPSCKPKSQLVFSRASFERRSVVWVERRANQNTRSGHTVLAVLPSHLIGIGSA